MVSGDRVLPTLAACIAAMAFGLDGLALPLKLCFRRVSTEAFFPNCDCRFFSFASGEASIPMCAAAILARVTGDRVHPVAPELPPSAILTSGPCGFLPMAAINDRSIARASSDVSASRTLTKGIDPPASFIISLNFVLWVRNRCSFHLFPDPFPT